jgi:hypothetical protein
MVKCGVGIQYRWISKNRNLKLSAKIEKYKDLKKIFGPVIESTSAEDCKDLSPKKTERYIFIGIIFRIACNLQNPVTVTVCNCCIIKI